MGMVPPPNGQKGPGKMTEITEARIASLIAQLPDDAVTAAERRAAVVEALETFGADEDDAELLAAANAYLDARYTSDEA